jgi:hypothetical protein
MRIRARMPHTERIPIAAAFGMRREAIGAHGGGPYSGTRTAYHAYHIIFSSRQSLADVYEGGAGFTVYVTDHRSVGFRGRKPMRHSLCLRMVHLICLGSFVIALWGCAADTSPAGTPSRRTLVDLLQSGDPGTPTAHPDTPTDQDWQLWTTIKARWPEVEKMLAERQAIPSTPKGTLVHVQATSCVRCSTWSQPK